MNKLIYFGVLFLTLIASLVFLASCVVTLSDGQGALIFIFSIPIMVALLLLAILLSRKTKREKGSGLPIDYVPKVFAGLLIVFFACAFIPGLRMGPDTFLGFVGKAFAQATGKTPLAFFKERASFPNKLDAALRIKKTVYLSDLDVTFAWDNVCIFGPYTNNEKAKSVLNLDWNIEGRSQIHFSDSINALVFLYQGRVNQVVDLKRAVADFRNVDVCLSREQTHFLVEVEPNGLKLLSLDK